MHSGIVGINVSGREIECFSRPQTHAGGGQDKRLVPGLSGAVDHARNLTGREYIGQRLYLRRLDDIYPEPFFTEDMVVTELQTISVNFDGAPGVRCNPVGEVILDIVER
jgi:hypothetical protein